MTVSAEHIAQRNKNHLLTFILLLFITLNATAQQTTIKARVTTFDLIAVMEAEVSTKKGKTMVMTDSVGNFTIECDLKDKLVIKAIGFLPKTIKVKKLTGVEKIDLEIAGSESDIDIAVANGHINESQALNAKKHYNDKKHYAYGFTNMTELVGTKFPNFKFVGDEVFIRGRTSLPGGSEKGALFVLNGSAYNWGSVKGFEVRLVKNLKVLSGTAATRYGSGSGNGVVLIELVSD